VRRRVFGNRIKRIIEQEVFLSRRELSAAASSDFEQTNLENDGMVLRARIVRRDACRMKRRPMVAVESFGNWRTQSRRLVMSSSTATARDVSGAWVVKRRC
jgi:hypothetical protein